MTTYFKVLFVVVALGTMALSALDHSAQHWQEQQQQEQQ